MKPTAQFGTVVVTADGQGLVWHAGVVFLAELAERVGLTRAMSKAMAETRERRSAHDPGRVLRDVAVMLADGGDCVSDMAAFDGQERLFGGKASQTTTHRVLKSVDGKWLDRIRAARAEDRARAWDAGARPRVDHAGHRCDARDRALGQGAGRRHLNTGMGFTRWGWLDETGASRGDPSGGNAGSNTGKDHFAVLGLALAQIPAQDLDREILVRCDVGGATHAFCADCREASIRFSVGYPLDETVRQALPELPETAWIQAVDADGAERTAPGSRS